jgi:threonine dehydrogenase-like Zn-dependent dehydrogenase
LSGRAIFCLHPHQTRYQVPLEAVHPLPEDVPPERAVLAANMETAVNGLWDLAPRLGDRIAVIGAGTLGCLVAWLASRIPGCAAELIDVNPGRAEVASCLGVAFSNPESASREADLVVHTSGSPAGLDTALDIAGFESTVLEMSWYGEQRVALPLGEGFHHRRLTLRSSQVGTVATAQRPRWDYRRRMALALSLLSDPVLDCVITGEDAFEELPGAHARLAAAPGDTICHRICYS